MRKAGKRLLRPGFFRAGAGGEGFDFSLALVGRLTGILLFSGSLDAVPRYERAQFGH